MSTTSTRKSAKSTPAKPARTARDLRRTIELLCAYGETRFGDDWWPGNASEWIGGKDGEELEDLLENVR